MLSLGPLRAAHARRHFTTGERPMVRLAKSVFRGRRRRKVGTDFPVQPGRVSPPRPVPGHIRKPHYVDSEAAAPANETCLHDAAGVAGMRDSCRRAAEVLEYAGQLVRPGITTDEIDRILHEHCIATNLYPSPLHYSGFPKSVCTSVNEVVCHGASTPPHHALSSRSEAHRRSPRGGGSPLPHVRALSVAGIPDRCGQRRPCRSRPWPGPPAPTCTRAHA